MDDSVVVFGFLMDYNFPSMTNILSVAYKEVLSLGDPSYLVYVQILRYLADL
jgi:hypothetical protein